MARLDDLFDVVGGGTPARSDASNFGGNIPWVKISDMLQGQITSTDETISEKGLASSSAKILPSGTVLLSIFATIGRTAKLGLDATTNQAIVGFLPRHPEFIDPDYFRRFLDKAAAGLAARSRGVAQNNINISIVRAIEIPLPPLPEQRRIAALLDQADALRAKRRRTLALLDELADALYVSMFGSRLADPQRWETARLGDVISGIDSGVSPVCQDRPAGEGEWGVLKLGAISTGEYKPARNNKALMPGVEPRRAAEVGVGNLLFSRKNTPELVGATAYVDETPKKMLLPDLIFRLTVGAESPLSPRFLQAMLAQPAARSALRRLASGSAASMSNISQARLLGLIIDVPPMQSQRDYESRRVAVNAMRSDVSREIETLDQLFASLQQRAFRGEL